MVDMHLEVDVIPVSDVDRSKQFYGRLGWRLDDDVAPADGVRIVQFAPPGSGCSVTLQGNNRSRAGFGRSRARRLRHLIGPPRSSRAWY